MVVNQIIDFINTVKKRKSYYLMQHTEKYIYIYIIKGTYSGAQKNDTMCKKRPLKK